LMVRIELAAADSLAAMRARSTRPSRADALFFVGRQVFA